MAHILSCPSLASYLRISIHTQYHLQVLSSIPGARDYIFHNSHKTLFLVVYTSALFGSLAPTELLLLAPLYRWLLFTADS